MFNSKNLKDVPQSSLTSYADDGIAPFAYYADNAVTLDEMLTPGFFAMAGQLGGDPRITRDDIIVSLRASDSSIVVRLVKDPEGKLVAIDPNIRYDHVRFN